MRRVPSADKSPSRKNSVDPNGYAWTGVDHKDAMSQAAKIMCSTASCPSTPSAIPRRVNGYQPHKTTWQNPQLPQPGINPHRNPQPPRALKSFGARRSALNRTQ